jgi:hypothetical protein
MSVTSNPLPPGWLQYPPYPMFVPIGCICPPGANKECERQDCPRRAPPSAVLPTVSPGGSPMEDYTNE